MLKNDKVEEELSKLKKRWIDIDPNLNDKYSLKVKECQNLNNENSRLKSNF